MKPAASARVSFEAQFLRPWVDIECRCAERMRFEHPRFEWWAASAKSRVFSGAPTSTCWRKRATPEGDFESSQREPDAWKIPAATPDSKSLPAQRTTAAALRARAACDESFLVDDRSRCEHDEVRCSGCQAQVVTRLVDKRRVRRDHADMFCTTPDGVRGQRAVEWRLVDTVARTQDFSAKVKERAVALAESSERPRQAAGVSLTPIERDIHAHGIRYRHVDVRLDRDRRTATCTLPARVVSSHAWTSGG